MIRDASRELDRGPEEFSALILPSGKATRKKATMRAIQSSERRQNTKSAIASEINRTRHESVTTIQA